MHLDIRTLAVLLSIVSFIQAVAIFLQYRINKNYHGIKWWTWSFALVALGFILLIMRDIINVELISIVAANSIQYLGLIFLYIGVLRFLDQRVYWGRLIAILGAYIVAVVYYTYIDNNISDRGVVIAAFIAALMLRMAHVLFHYKFKAIASSANFVAGLFLITGILFIIRALAMLTVSPLENYFAPGPLQVSLFLAIPITSLLLTFGLIIMINQRLNAEIKEAHESYELIFSTSSDAAVVTRFQDGSIVNVNNGFTALTDFTREEALGKTTMDINIWNNPADRQNVIKELTEKGSCDNYEVVLKRKDGSLFPGLMSAKIIPLHGIFHVVSFTRDITERKLAEIMLEEEKQRLQKALDEVRTLRGIVPICASCKKIRDDGGYWNQVEQYVSAHSEAEFSHSICPDCFEKLYPEYMTNEE
ncbi:MAG: PAS domain S-box protein [Smithellaceae bacterium]